MAKTEQGLQKKEYVISFDEHALNKLYKVMGLADCSSGAAVWAGIELFYAVSLAKAKGSSYFIECFNEQAQETLEYLAKLTHATESEVVAEALKHYERKVLQTNPPQNHHGQNRSRTKGQD